MRSANSLVARVALVTGVCAGGAALIAAIGSVVIADHMVLDEEDVRLRGTATLAASEIPQTSEAEIRKAVAEEVAELGAESIRVAVRDNTTGELFGGDEGLARPAPSTCESRRANGLAIRSCTLRSGRLDIVTSATRTEQGLASLAFACVVAALCAAIAGALIARRSARWALAPLTRLSTDLDRITGDTPTADIPGDDTCREVAVLRAALASLVGRLGETLGAARRFSADAAHELKTPLTTLSVELELLAEEPLDASTKVVVEKLRRRTAALTSLVERLLVLARVGESAAVASVPVALEDVATDVIARLGDDARTRVVLRTDAQGMVRGDNVLLGALFENALDNALKFSGDASVEVHLSESESIVVLEITDRGPGLAKAERSRAFEPFFRTAEARANVPGHGIGLALVAHIARAHEGTASFVDVDTGARLRIELPPWTSRT